MGYSAGSTGTSGGILAGIHWPAALGYSAAYLAGIAGGLWWDTRRDPLQSRSGRIHWRAALAGYLAGSTADTLASYSGILSGILGGIWRDTWRDLASRSGGILGGIHWRAALAGYSAGSTGEQLWKDTGRDPLASSSGGIVGGIHWRAALAGYSAGSTGELL